MNTINSEKASKVLVRILNVANKIMEAYILTRQGKFSQARAIIYDLDRFEISSIRSELVDLEFDQMKGEKL